MSFKVLLCMMSCMMSFRIILRQAVASTGGILFRGSGASIAFRKAPMSYTKMQALHL